MVSNGDLVQFNPFRNSRLFTSVTSVCQIDELERWAPYKAVGWSTDALVVLEWVGNSLSTSEIEVAPSFGPIALARGIGRNTLLAAGLDGSLESSLNREAGTGVGH